MPSRHRRRRRRSAAALGAVGAAATLAICGAPGTFAAFSDFGTVGVQADAGLWGDLTPGWLAHCGDLDQYDEIVYADAISVLGVSIATVDGDTPWLDTGHPKVIDLHSGGGDNQIIVGAKDATNIVYGGQGNDCLVGGDETDVLAGDGGDDVLLGGDGADFLFGMSGADTLYGGSGFDTMAGGLNPGDAVYWEGSLLKDLPLALPWQIHTPDPTVGVHLLMLRSMGLATTSAGVGDMDTSACSESMSAALPDTPPTGAGAQDLIDSLNTTKAQCLAGDENGAKGALIATPSSGSPSSDAPSDPAAPKTDTSSSDAPAPTKSATSTPTPTPSATPSATPSGTAPVDPPSGTSTATGAASATATPAATTESSEGGQS